MFSLCLDQGCRCLTLLGVGLVLIGIMGWLIGSSTSSQVCKIGKVGANMRVYYACWVEAQYCFLWFF